MYHTMITKEKLLEICSTDLSDMIITCELSNRPSSEWYGYAPLTYAPNIFTLLVEQNDNKVTILFRYFQEKWMFDVEQFSLALDKYFELTDICCWHGKYS